MVASRLFLNSSGESQTCRPPSLSASVAAVVSLPMSVPWNRTALQCRSSRMICSSRQVMAGSKTRRVTKPPP